MGNKKIIGNTINEKLHSLNKTPNQAVWSGIELELNKRKKRRVIFFWFWLKPISLLIIGLATAFYVYTNNYKPIEILEINNPKSVEENNKPSQNNNSKTRSKTILEPETKISIVNEDLIEINSEYKNESNKNENSSRGIQTRKASSNFKKQSKQNTNTKNISNTKSNSEYNKNANKVRENENTTKEIYDPNQLTGNSSLKTYEANTEETMVIKKDSIPSKKEKTKKITLNPEEKTEKDSLDIRHNFEIDLFLSPTFYGSFSNKSSLDSRLNANSKSSIVQLSYGLGISFNLTDKLSTRLGLGLTNLSLETKNATVNTTNYTNIDYSNSISNQTIYINSNYAETMNIAQKISYIEIPIEVKYKFIDNKIGVKGILGFSFLYLNQNKINIVTDTGFSQTIGTTSNLVKGTMSGNIGLGFDYKLNKKLKIIIEPIFSYQFKTFEYYNDIEHYSFGIRTGLQYSFYK